MVFKFLQIQRQASQAVERLLNTNVIGTPGLSMLYQHLGVKEKLYKIPKPHIVSIQRNDRVVGTCCFCERELDGRIGFYVRYFAFREMFRLKQVSPQLQSRKASTIRAEIIELLNGKGLATDEQTSFFQYAYVDPRNPRSARLCTEFGFVPVRQYTTKLFSRLWPKQHSDIAVKTLPANHERVRAWITSFYKDYQHVSFENLRHAYYYIEDEQGEIIAGVQVNPDAWRIVSLPGKNGKALLHFFNRVPLLSSLLSKHFRFLAVEGIYYKEGKEKNSEQLLEALLQQHDLHTAIMVVDIDSSLHTLTRKINLGLLDKISPSVYGNVIVRNHPIDEARLSQQKSRPAYISVMDVS